MIAPLLFRGVAQPGSALHWGCSGRRFKSCRPDQIIKKASLAEAFLIIGVT